MNKKKIALLSLTSLLSASLLVFTGLMSFSRGTIFSTKADVPYSCEYYFNDDNGYTSIYDLNEYRISEGTDIVAKTWGTVTNNYVTGSKYCSIIQSTNKYGDVGGTVLYNIDSEQQYPVGSVVSVTGTMTLYNGMSEMTGVVVNRDVNVSDYPPEPYVMTSIPTDSTEKMLHRYMGMRLVEIDNVTLYSLGSNKCYAELPNNQSITLYYGSLESTSAIYSKLYSVSQSGNADVKGYLCYYTNDNAFQLYLREPTDITLHGAVGPTLDEIQLGECVTTYHVGDTFVKPNVYAIYSDGTYDNVTDEAEFYGYDMASAGTYTVHVEYGGLSTTYTIEVISEGTWLEENVSFVVSNKYDTGNYGRDGNYEYYRAVGSTGNLAKLLPLENTHGVDTLGGAIYNINPIKDIKQITITYKTSTTSGYSYPKVYYGENNYDESCAHLSYTTSMETIDINLNTYHINYFRIDSGDTELTINSISLYYTGEDTPNGSSFINHDANDGQYRIDPVVCSDTTLVDGVSYVDFPIEYDTDTQTVTQTKRYTYYSYEYVSTHRGVKAAATMLDAADVSNYFLAFGCAPANYGVVKGTVNALRDGKTLPDAEDVNDVFGDDARGIQQFSRTDGYAQAVPYAGVTPTYYELDIKVDDTYSTSNRSVGRVVAWATGFSIAEYGYGNVPVCTFTDDHYATFCEYNNCGAFLPRFNGERMIAGAVWSNPTTYLL